MEFYKKFKVRLNIFYKQRPISYNSNVNGKPIPSTENLLQQGVERSVTTKTTLP